MVRLVALWESPTGNNLVAVVQSAKNDKFHLWHKNCKSTEEKYWVIKSRGRGPVQSVAKVWCDDNFIRVFCGSFILQWDITNGTPQPEKDVPSLYPAVIMENNTLVAFKAYPTGNYRNNCLGQTNLRMVEPRTNENCHRVIVTNFEDAITDPPVQEQSKNVVINKVWISYALGALQTHNTP